MVRARLRPVLAGALLLCATPDTVPAQVLAVGAAVRGRVLDAETRKPMGNVVVDIFDQGRRMETREDGSFEFTGMQPQLVTVRMRAIGYQVVERSLNLFAGKTVAVEYVMSRPPPRMALGTRGAVELADVVVEASSPTARMLEAFEERRRLGIGTFFTAADFAGRGHATLPEVIRGAPGVQFVRVGTNRDALASSRQGIPVGGNRLNGACFMQVVVDGMSVWSAEPPSRPGAIVLEPPDLAMLVPVSDLAAVEVYAGVAGMPLQYRRNGSVCGAILMWTKRGGYTPTLR